MRIIILLLAFQLVNAVTFDLDQCLDFAEKNNKSIQISNYQKDISVMNVKDARNRFFDVYGRDNNIFSMDDDENMNINFSTSVGVTGTLSSGLIHNYQYSGISSENSFLDHTNSVNSLRNQVTSAFFGVLIAKENLKLQKDKLEYSQKKFEEAKLRFDMGNMSQSDLLSFEVTLSEDTIDLKNKESALKKQKQNLLYLMHNQIKDEEFDIEYKEELDTTFNFVKKDLIDEALKNRPDILKYQNYLGQQDLMLKMQYDNFLPSLSGDVYYNYTKYHDFNNDLFSNSSDGIKGNLTLSLNLSYSNCNSIDKNKVELKKSKLSFESKVLEIKNDITSKLIDLQNQKNNLELADKHIELAEKNLELAEKLFAIGDKSVSDYLKARNDFISAKNRKINYLYSFIISKYDLYNSVGRR
ncbi:MAG: TolC family protein [Candidatus Delongbacteria bacterium]|jgi:outer membrane protein TolC|nr:TolC family protein [Candidatus Delongbacteria bacterium]